MQLNSPRILRAAAFGAVAGFVNFVILEPSTRASEIAGSSDKVGNALTHAFILFGLLGFLVGAALALADEVGGTSSGRLASKLTLSAVLGGLLGGTAGLVGQIMFSALLAGSAIASVPNVFTIIIARTLGWAAVGAGTGLSRGAATGDGRRALLGLAGGAIGGAVGGIMFDMLSIPAQSGTVSRLVGLTAIGACVGAAVTIIEEAAKAAWITRVVGRNEGKQYILSKPVTRIGRDELLEIPLFGDQSVARLHATIETSAGKQFAIRHAGSPTGTFVNNQPISYQMLKDGDSIRIGTVALLFSQKVAANTAYAPQYPQMPAQQCSPYQQAPPQQSMPQYQSGPAQMQMDGICAFCGQPRNPVTGLCPCSPGVAPTHLGAATATGAMLFGRQGMHTGASFALSGMQTVVGRDTSNPVCLANDGGVSRRHASICLQNGQWTITDEGSSNGTFVNGSRINTAYLNNGDMVHIGNTTFEFRAG